MLQFMVGARLETTALFVNNLFCSYIGIVHSSSQCHDDAMLFKYPMCCNLRTYISWHLYPGKPWFLAMICHFQWSWWAMNWVERASHIWINLLYFRFEGNKKAESSHSCHTKDHVWKLSEVTFYRGVLTSVDCHPLVLLHVWLLKISKLTLTVNRSLNCS